MALGVQRTFLSSSSSALDLSAPLAPSSSPSLEISGRRTAAFKVRSLMNQTESDMAIKGSRRREILGGIGSSSIASLFFSSQGAFAAKAPSGYQAVLDNFDKYQFLYPFGWQEVSVKGQDCVYKDVIEPLESVSVNIIETNKTDIKEFGTPDEVAKTLVNKVLTSPSQKPQLVEAKERVADGITYYTFEFTSKASNYIRHALSTVTVYDGKFYTLTTGANERRWGKLKDKLRVVADSFAVLL